jgi:hypothetical protein
LYDKIINIRYGDLGQIEFDVETSKGPVTIAIKEPSDVILVGHPKGTDAYTAAQKWIYDRYAPFILATMEDWRRVAYSLYQSLPIFRGIKQD